MLHAPWRNVFGPPLVVMGTAALLSLAAAQLATAAAFAPQLAAIAPDASDCSSVPGVAVRAVGRRSGGVPPVVQQKLDALGQFAGRNVIVRGAGRSLSISLPAESFVGAPAGDAVVYTSAVGGRSEVHVIDLAAGCDVIVARPPGIVRSALLDPSGAAVYVHSVSNPSRQDAGVSRFALDGSAVQLVVPPLPDDPRFGVTFGTQLGWSVDGATLFVQSCDVDSCRTRLMDVASGAIWTYDGLGQGSIVGVSPAHVVAFGDCTGLPCSVISVDRATHASTTLADAAWSASLAAGGDRSAIVRIETAAGIVEVNQ